LSQPTEYVGFLGVANKFRGALAHWFRFVVPASTLSDGTDMNRAPTYLAAKTPSWYSTIIAGKRLIANQDHPVFGFAAGPELPH